MGGLKLFQNLPAVAAEPTSTIQTNAALLPLSSATITSQPIKTAAPTLFQTSIPATPEPGIGSSMISEKDGMTLMYVPAGEFTMGSNDGDADEKPAHTIYLDAFWIDRTEVTNKMNSVCVKAGICEEPTSKRSYDHSSYYGNAEYDNNPVIWMDWSSAQTYCAWVGRRLPSEAEWEKAACGTDARIYPWGNDPPNGTLISYNYDTSIVGKYPLGASPYGALDMASNVWEWVADWYSETYYSSSPTSNPFGANSGQYRILRGGAWDNPLRISATYRYEGDPANHSSNVGFRCAMSATP